MAANASTRQRRGFAASAAAGSAHAGPTAAAGGFDDSYNAVPPPAALASSSSAAPIGRRAFSIRPQLPKQQQPPSASPMVAAFQQAATKLGTGTAGASGAPAYTAVQVPSQQQHIAAPPAAAAAVGPQQWPPALKAYVERAFKAADLVGLVSKGHRIGASRYDMIWLDLARACVLHRSASGLSVANAGQARRLGHSMRSALTRAPAPPRLACSASGPSCRRC